jgi:hypothetical protein
MPPARRAPALRPPAWLLAHRALGPHPTRRSPRPSPPAASVHAVSRADEDNMLVFFWYIFVLRFLQHFWVPAFLGRPPFGSGAEAPNPEIPAPPVWLKKPHGGLRNFVSRVVAAKERKHAGGGGDARRRLLRAAQRVGVRVCVAGARDARAMGCCRRRSADARAAGSHWCAVCMKVCSAPRNAVVEEEGGDVRAPRAPCPS